LRPLIHEDGKKPSELSRKDEMFISESGLISIAGGKLTGYRLMAKRVTDMVASLLRQKDGRRFQKCSTQAIVLTGAGFQTEQELEEYKHELLGEARQVNATYFTISALVNKYGRNAGQIVETAYAIWPGLENKTIIMPLAEMLYAINEEMCIHPSDFFIRRTSCLYFNRLYLMDEFELLYPWFVRYASLTDDVAREFRYQFLHEVDAVMDFLQDERYS
jgi:glycerol-3-phosphate dehydrogenase